MMLPKSIPCTMDRPLPFVDTRPNMGQMMSKLFPSVSPTAPLPVLVAHPHGNGAVQLVMDSPSGHPHVPTMILQPIQHPLYGPIFVPSYPHHDVVVHDQPSVPFQPSHPPSFHSPPPLPLSPVTVSTVTPPTPFDEDTNSEWSQLMHRLALEPTSMDFLSFM